MSISVTNLSKAYGQHKAVNNISFSVQPGEIVGFLGPNGAGKSTTLKIITGFLTPSAGIAMVCGQEVSARPSVRQWIGYLPEHNPLYLDMYVHEFLHFVGKVCGLQGAALKKRIAEMVQLCGLTAEQNKRIESLSKGYRQRVGLAQALLHDPKVLVLDEPTTGLDPNQIIEIRQLIKTISKDKTVIFSTHIMQEVQAICDRALVIHNGRIVADDRIENLLARQSATTSFVADFGQAVSAEDLRLISGVEEVTMLTTTSCRLTSFQAEDLRPEIFRFAADRKLSLVGLRQEERSLESVFQDLTQNPPAV